MNTGIIMYYIDKRESHGKVPWARKPPIINQVMTLNLQHFTKNFFLTFHYTEKVHNTTLQSFMNYINTSKQCTPYYSLFLLLILKAFACFLKHGFVHF